MNQRKDLLKESKSDVPPVVYFSGSSLQDLSCYRKAHYKHGLGLVQPAGIAANFGTAVHYALADFYKTAVPVRSVDQLKAAFKFKFDSLGVPEDEIRNETFAFKMLESYFEIYGKGDNYRVYCDNNGPFVERSFDVHVVIRDGIQYRLTGTIDLLVEDIETGELLVMDHKSSRSLGKEFISKHSMSAQMLGYAYAASRVTGRPVKRVVINGLQLAKTKQTSFRVEYETTPFMIQEYIKESVERVRSYLMSELKPKAFSQECSAYGGCGFIDACSAFTEQQRQAVLQSFDTRVRVMDE